MKLIVDKASRLAKMRAHTCAHLLNAQLDKILGGTKQSGSYVDQDYFRFDFTASQPLTQDQINQIEKEINDIIYQSLEVTVEEVSFDEAIKLGAKAFFEDKYGDKVRLVCVNSPRLEKAVSIELCGGTHISDTAMIGAFKIISQESVASGIRRISAITGPKVAELAIQKDNYLNEIGIKLNSPANQILESINKMETTLDEYKSKLESYMSMLISQEINNIMNQDTGKDGFDMIINLSANKILKDINLKDLGNILKASISKSFVVYNNEGSFIIGGSQAKAWATQNGLKGGGSDTFFQGKDAKILQII